MSQINAQNHSPTSSANDLSALDWTEILRRVQSFATSGTAREAIEQIGPLTSAHEATQSFDVLADAMQLLAGGVRPFMESLDLFDSWMTRINKKAVLKTLEIKDVRQFLLETIALRETFDSNPSGWSRRLLNTLMSPDEPLSAIDQIMTARGEIRSDASERLYGLFREKENLTKQVDQSLNKLVNEHQMSGFLQDKFVTTREGRWVLPIRGGSQHFVSGVIHGSSQTKQTVFIEPEVVIPINNRLRQIENEIDDEIERLLKELSQYLWGFQQDFIRSQSALLEADISLAKAQLCREINGTKPAFDSSFMFLPEVRHPLLTLGGKPVVANTVRIGEDARILLLSGPNAGGKTVLLKSIGLTAQLARCGFLVPTIDGAVLPFFKNIHISIGDNQSVEAELSTFAAHMKNLTRASELAGPENLILVDEICGSTDPEEGSALARGFIEKFSAQKTLAVVTSHLGPLKTGWKTQDGVLNGSLEYDAKTGRPTYQFLSGIAGESLALQTAKRVGVPDEILARAIEHLTPASRARLSKLEELESLKSDLHTLQEHLKKETQRAKNETEKYKALTLQMEKEKESMLAKLKKESEKKIDDMIAAAKVDQTFKRHSTLQEIKTQLPEIIKAKPTTNSNTVNTAEEFARIFPPGTKVFVPSLNQDGLIQSIPNNKGEIFVLSGAVRLSLPWQELKPPHQATNPTANLVRRSKTVTIALNDSERTLDVRGKTVEEALADLELQMDHSVTLREDRMKVIHGHGTEALKKAVRTYLSRSSYVKKWRAGTPEQGGDGATWVELNTD